MAIHVLLEVSSKDRGRLRQVGVAAGTGAWGAGESLLDAAQQVETGAVFFIERVAHLSLEAHGRPNNGIQVL